MLIAIGSSEKDGRPFTVLGLERENVERLMRGEPILKDMGRYGHPELGEVLIVFGEDVEAIEANLSDGKGLDARLRMDERREKGSSPAVDHNRVGDRGQRYEVRYMDAETSTEKVMGWTDKADGGALMLSALRWPAVRQRPDGTRIAWVVDRRPGEGVANG